MYHLIQDLTASNSFKISEDQRGSRTALFSYAAVRVEVNLLFASSDSLRLLLRCITLLVGRRRFHWLKLSRNLVLTTTVCASLTQVIGNLPPTLSFSPASLRLQFLNFGAGCLTSAYFHVASCLDSKFHLVASALHSVSVNIHYLRLYVFTLIDILHS